ncbi:MAG: c-type cytochrome [Phenylobacterium sp.]|nr:c-type cytochrome [Phenylobacterium sp.]
MATHAPRIPVLLATALVLSGCGAPDRAQDPFRQTGELIALSGGDGGADNACFTCHGRDGRGDGQAVPRLAGLSSGYMLRQLDDYASGRRPDDVMTPIAKRLSETDRRKVSNYYAGLAIPPTRARTAVDTTGAVLYAAGDSERGVLACARCHGPDGAGDAANPPLAGQPAAYIARQMDRFARGERRNDPRGVMWEISRRLTPSETAAVSAYAAGLGASSPPAR